MRSASGPAIVSERDPSRRGGGEGLGTILHSSCPNVDLTNQIANDVREMIFLQAFGVASD